MIWMLACAPDPAPHEPGPTSTIPPTGTGTPTGTDLPTGTGTETTPPVTTQNVMVVLFDDLGVASVGLYGNRHAPPTPTFDGLAAEGTLFRNAWAMSLCSATRAAVMTGRYPTRTGVGSVMEFIGYADVAPLADSERTIPEMLAESPDTWDTSHVGKWHLSDYQDPAAAEAPGIQGFAWYAGSVGNLDYNRNGTYYKWHRDDNGTVDKRYKTYATTSSADDAIDRLAVMTEPWYLDLSFNAPHRPYEAPPSDLAVPKSDDPADLYDAMITAADKELGRVLASMDPEVRARTTIIVTGDNGTPDDLGIPHSGKQKYTMYEGGIHVPFVVAGPRVAVPGSTTDALVDVTDLFPTIAEIADVPLEPDDVDGTSFLSVLADPTTSARQTIYSELFLDRVGSYSYALRDDRYKLLVTKEWYYTPSGNPNGAALFDLVADPDEKVDLATTDPTTLERLTGEADALRQHLDDLAL